MNAPIDLGPIVHTIAAADARRKAIKQDIEAFLAAGGTIQSAEIWQRAIDLTGTDYRHMVDRSNFAQRETLKQQSQRKKAERDIIDKVPYRTLKAQHRLTMPCVRKVGDSICGAFDYGPTGRCKECKRRAAKALRAKQKGVAR